MKYLNTKAFKILLGFIFFSALFFLLYKLYMPRVNAFGCFDDCFNFMGGYFILQGKKIFADFFYNHQPGMAYLSAFVQFVDKPNSIAELIISHRKFIWIASFSLTFLLYLRFGYKIVLVSILYEFSKFYVFGDRFLAESLLGYLTIYQAGVIFELIRGKVNKIDVYTMPLASWAIVFLREPYTLTTLFLLSIYSIHFYKKDRKSFYKIMSIFAFLSIMSFLLNSPKEYIFNVFTINQERSITESLKDPLIFRIFSIFFYPLKFIISDTPWTLLRTYIASLSFVFIAASLIAGLYLKKWKLLAVIFLILALSNLRPEPVNKTFFEAFHINVWLQVLIFSTVYLIFMIFKSMKKASLLLVTILVFSFFALIINNGYFVHEKINTSDEFFINFSEVMGAGTIIRDLASKNDNLFVDGYDDLVLWEAKVKSSYKYSWLTSSMPSIKIYSDERVNMFRNSPPDFYYGKCLSELTKEDDFVSKYISNNYIQYKEYKKRGCILLSKSKYGKVESKN